jgi:hypothetical protein
MSRLSRAKEQLRRKLGDFDEPKPIVRNDEPRRVKRTVP